MPQLNTIAVDYEAKGIRVVAVNLQESLETVQQFQESYPDILFLQDNGTVWDDYLQDNYIPLNYVLNHDLDQTVEYWEEGYYEDEVLDTINAVRSRLVATLHPEGDSYARGETIGYDIEIKSWSLMSQQAYVVLDAVFPSGSSYRLGLAYITFNLAEEKTFHRQHVIPMTVPAGDYRIRVQVGAPGDLLSADSFGFSVAP